MLALVTAAAAAEASELLQCGQRRAFIDMGANDGQSLLWFERQQLASGRYNAVFAFEMNPAFVSVLRTILKRMPGGQLEEAAVWKGDGSMEANLQLPGSRTAIKHGVLYNMTARYARRLSRMAKVALVEVRDSRHAAPPRRATARCKLAACP